MKVQILMLDIIICGKLRTVISKNSLSKAELPNLYDSMC